MSRKKKFDFDLIVKHSRDLRKNSTESENLLWNELRGRKLSGYKFSRQHPILYGGNLIRYNYFVADFYCAVKKAIIELDGSIHLATKEYDNYRDSELNYYGYNILRIKNEDLNNMQETLVSIITFLNQLPDNR